MLSLNTSPPTDEHCSPKTEHTMSQLRYADPMYHCMAVVVAEGEAPVERVAADDDVMVLEAVCVTEGVAVGETGPQRTL
jgi:hypothetical protein